MFRFNTHTWSFVAPANATTLPHSIHRPAYYLITELKEQSLRAYMNSNPQPDKMIILRMASEVVSAINFLHSRSVVHRDLKPENVLLDQFLSVFLCDFGIAKQMDATERAVDMTSDMGTAAYMAPELASSKLLDDIEDNDLVMYVGCRGLCTGAEAPVLPGRSGMHVFFASHHHRKAAFLWFQMSFLVSHKRTDVPTCFCQ